MSELITEVDVLDESKECFLTYAEEVLTDRAIPSAEDGLLSVHRKLLWTMEDVLKMDNKNKFKKSASIVGSTLATSYFHGDSSCYGALCKLAQQYLMRYPLIEGEGNLGTQEGNGLEAASRYTNAKPSKYADLMMNDFDKEVVPMKETYNGEYYEPVVLPSIFPNALVNGREAIGVSMAHESQPMCLSEVCDGIIAYINNNDITVDGLMEYIKGPDYPLGNIVINKKDIRAAFMTGKSSTSLKVRGDYIVEDNKIIFTSIPYRTYRNKIKEQINKNIDEFDKVIEDFYDESSIGNNKLIFYVKSGVPIKKALNTIFSLTDLQASISYNMNYIVNGTPKLCSLKDLIIAYVNHQYNILINAAKYDKDKAEAREHILEGLIIALGDIDKAIELIRASENKDEAVQKLTSYFILDDIQAKAILDMKLSRLTKIDKEDIEKELKEKINVINDCNNIINNSDYRSNVLINKVKWLKDNYGDARRTQLVDLDETISKEEKEIAKVIPEQCVITLTESGLIKRIPSSSFKNQHRNTKGIKSKDDIIDCSIRTNTIDNLMIFTNKGRMYKILVDEVPLGTNSSKGVPISSLVEMENGESATLIYSIYRETDAKYILFTTKNGIIKKTPLDDFISIKKKAGTNCITLSEGDSLCSVNLVKDEDVILITNNGMTLKFPTNNITPTGRTAKGVLGMKLKENDFIVSTLIIRDKNDYLAVFLANGLGKKIKLSEFPLQSRNCVGLSCVKTSSTYVAGAALINDTDNLFITGSKSFICISANEISLLSRQATGIGIIKDSNITSITKYN